MGSVATHDLYYKNPDTGILLNTGFCLLVAVPLFTAFCLLRRRIFRLYDANLVSRNRYCVAGCGVVLTAAV